MRIPERSVAFSRPLRAIALLVVVAPLARELAALASGSPPTLVWVARFAMSVIAVAVAAVSSPRRSPQALRAAAFTLGCALTLTNVVVASLLPGRVWETIAVDVAVILGAALFVPWSPRWQAALAATVTTMALVALSGVIERSGASAGAAPGATVDLPTRSGARLRGN